MVRMVHFMFVIIYKAWYDSDLTLPLGVGVEAEVLSQGVAQPPPLQALPWGHLCGSADMLRAA